MIELHFKTYDEARESLYNLVDECGGILTYFDGFRVQSDIMYNELTTEVTLENVKNCPWFSLICKEGGGFAIIEDDKDQMDDEWKDIYLSTLGFD